MRKLLFGLIGMSMLFVGTCVQDVGLKLGTNNRYCDSAYIIGCTLDRTGQSLLPGCPYYH